MHIPNGFLTDPICTVSTLVSGGTIGYGVTRIRETDSSRSAALMAATGAGIFAAQMINFPVDPGTSAHVVGAALVAIALGPWRGMLTMGVVLAAQAFLFGDGGWRALGANVLNMAVVGTLVASVLYAFTTRRIAGASGKLLGAGVAAFGSVMAAAAMVAVELAASGTYTAGGVLAAMLSVHLVIALCEAVITMAVVAAALALMAEKKTLSTRGLLLGGLALAVVLAGLVGPWASTRPDGLERVAADLNFANLATGTPALAPDYEAPLVTWPAVAVALAGIGGALFVFASSYMLGRTAKVRVRKR